MARKLTNAQMNILAERVTDLLEEANEAKMKSTKESAEYVNFDTEYSDEIADVLRKNKIDCDLKKAQKKQIEEDLERIDAESQALVPNTYRYADTGRVLSDYLTRQKDIKYPGMNFNRDKILRKVQADILLSDIDNPEQLVQELVTKLNKPEN